MMLVFKTELDFIMKIRFALKLNLIVCELTVGMATVVAANQTVVSPNAVPVQIISSTGQVVSQAVVQSTPQQANVMTAVQPIQSAPKPKTHFCVSCGKGFAAKHGLLQHNRRHPNGSCTLRTHVCECGKAFFQKNHLMLHQRQHLETKPNTQQVRL